MKEIKYGSGIKDVLVYVCYIQAIADNISNRSNRYQLIHRLVGAGFAFIVLRLHLLKLYY